jgi:hypothetical protein
LRHPAFTTASTASTAATATAASQQRGAGQPDSGELKTHLLFPLHYSHVSSVFFGMLSIVDSCAFACRTEHRPTCPAMRRSLSQIFRQKYRPKCAFPCHPGLAQKFCTAGIGTRANFVIERLKGLLSGPGHYL